MTQPRNKAVRERLAIDLGHGRSGKSYFDAVMALAAEARVGYAEVLGADPTEVALTSSTTGGNRTIDWVVGDGTVTSATGTGAGDNQVVVSPTRAVLHRSVEPAKSSARDRSCAPVFTS